MFCMYVWSTSAGFSAAAPGFADFCCKQGQDIYPGHWPFVSHRLRATGSATPIWPLQQNCPSHRASRIIRQRFFKVFSETIRKAFVRPHVKMQGGTEPGPPSALADPGNYTLKKCCQGASAQQDVMQLCMKEDLPLHYVTLGFIAAERSGLHGDKRQGS